MAKTFKQHIINDIYCGQIARLVAAKNDKVRFIRLPKRELLEQRLSQLHERAYTIIGELNGEAHVTPEPLPFSRKHIGRKVALAVGTQWAQTVFDCAWLHFYGDLPADIADNSQVVCLVNCGGEGAVYDVDGNIKQGITCYASDYDYTLGLPVKKVIIANTLIQGDKIEFYVDCGANDLFGKFKNKAAIGEMSIAIQNTAIRALAYDCETLLGVYDNCKSSEFTLAIFKTVGNILLHTHKITEEKAEKYRELLQPFFATKNDSENTFEYSAIGHAHLDLGWLWPIRETKRKGARTFSTQLMNIERYDDYIFGASQAQLYLWIKKHYPSIYAKVKEQVACNRWELQGATWVEMDSNLISGESLIRQFYYGKKFFKEEFGEDMRVLWLPDSFGYSACIPTVMALAGVPYFVTQKMSWNTVNKFPYNTFKWVGLDGSEALAHMLPENNYNSPMRADFLVKGEKNYHERNISNIALSLFGIGDGGAGAGFEHIERAERLKDIKGMPKVKMEKAIDFFEKLDNKDVKYPTYNGELYLERHQGTYTTQAKNKRYNRKCEILLKNYEFLCARLVGKTMQPPISYAELEDIWKDILLFQFHDILPGSSINRVYEESVSRYAEIYNRLKSAIETIVKGLCVGQGFINFNPFSYEKVLKLDNDWYRLAIPALSSAPIKYEYCLGHYEAIITANTMENDAVRVEFKNGYIVSLFDKTLSKEFVAKGKRFNVFSAYTDNGDGWDIRPVRYQSSKRDAKCTAFVISRDGAEAFAKVSYAVDKIVIDQKISITDGSALVSFATSVYNNSSCSMLRVAFPVAINTDICKFNIQFGHIARKTTSNNSVERAQFEVSGQKFIDMSDDENGISILNDSKYGFRCKNNVMDINLIRSPKGGPSTNVDQGANIINYAVFTHEGALGLPTYKEAYLFNNPFMLVNSERHPFMSRTVYKSSNENIVLESIKKTDDSDDIVVRYYNCSEYPQTARVIISGYRPVAVVDIMENAIDECKEVLSLRPFELINIRMAPITAL